MNIFLDTIPLDITFETEKNIGDVLKALEIELETNEATIIEVSIDDEIVPAEQLDSLFDKEIGSVNTLSVKSISYSEVSNVLKQLFIMFGTLSGKLEEIPLQLQQNEDKKAMNSVAELADSLSLLFQTIPYINLFTGKFSTLVIEDKSLTDFVQQFPPLLEDFLKAVEANDTVLIGDLAEYEIAPRLKELSTLAESL